jgi:anti-anti-sigma regulatory factor
MTDKPFTVKFRSNHAQQTVEFTGNLIINHIEEILEKVKKKIDSSKTLCVKITEPENIDLTFIQMVISLQKTWQKNGHDITIETTIKEDIKLILNNSGFNLFLN